MDISGKIISYEDKGCPTLIICNSVSEIEQMLYGNLAKSVYEVLKILEKGNSVEIHQSKEEIKIMEVRKKIVR